MQTCLGEVELWDGHAHFFSRKFFEVLGGQSPLLTGVEGRIERIGELTGFRMPSADPVELGAEWIEQMQRYSVAGMLLISSLPGDEDSIAAAVRCWPDRIAGGFFFDPTQPGVEARAQRAFDELGLSVACLFPAMHYYSVAECEGVRVLASLVSERTGKAIFVHCGVLSIGVRKRLGLQSRFDLRYSNPLDLHVVAKEFERVHFIIPHFGAGMFREALMVAEHCPNVYLDTAGSNSWMKYESLDLKEVYRRAVQVVGWERLIFGTDSSFFPRGWQSPVFEAQLQALEALAATPQQAQAVLGGNLKRLLGRM